MASKPNVRASLTAGAGHSTVKPLYVCFYTPDYAGEADELVSTLCDFDLPYEVRMMADRGEWVLNCGAKPQFMAAMRAEYPDRPLVYLDADARVRQRPSLLDVLDGVDVAAHYRGGKELLSGTLYFGPTHAADGVINRWMKAAKANPRTWDQQVLQRVLDNDKGLDVYRLPPSYCRIFDARDMGEEVVIEQMQASRRLARKK